ncbi:LacI family DNA-binding transcriptional regulator [Cellulomonas sp. RIT-PI-Y]|uniref:LacI family DNA-binding transcriptional regulator n=1 Tax=Cellulomonas sp. RIT-PI-Y TaxID=3035297 RepID=UPI0021DA4C9D|nr:LacI family DNA-binding transcriptional regulator [Cellulomonas sp. RIT-PI-Y]
MAHGIVDVARAAGVSTATVSRALRGLPNVHQSTRERVLRVADELGYVPSPSAASLASGRTRTIGLISPWVSHWFFANVIEGAERALRAEGFDALLYTFEVERGTRRLALDPGVLRRRVDGVLVVGLPLEPPEIAALDELGYPLVFVGPGAPEHATVGLDDAGTAHRAVAHLAELGHRVVAHLSGEPDDVLAWSPAVRRAQGWREEVTRRGLDGSPELEVHGHFDVAGGRASMHRLLDSRPDVTAVFAASDEMAMGAILAIRDRGLRVPEDVSVIGVDGHEMSEHLGLTTLAQDAYEQGVTAATMLLELLTGSPVPPEVVFPTTLVVRSSTGPVTEL